MMMDSTFGVTNCSAKMFTLMVIDPENFSQICCIFYSKDESLIVLHPIFEKLKALGNNFDMVESFMKDKDASERNTISKFFKNAVFLLCYFHAVKAYLAVFKRTHNIKFDYLRTYLETAKVKIFVKEQI